MNDGPFNFRLRLLDEGLVLKRPSILEPPNLDTIETDTSRPAIANPTNGPHRYTIVVPYNDNATFSIGQGSHRILDTGITGRTDSHVHFHTVKAPNQTMMLLGGKTDEGYAGFNGDNVLGKAQGYAMVTDQNAYVDAKGQFVGIAREKDLVLHAAGGGVRAVLQAPQGSVDIVAGVQAHLVSKGTVSITAQPAAQTEDPVYNTAWKGTTEQTKVPPDAEIANGAVKLAMAAHDLVTKIPKLVKVPKTGWNSWEVESRVADVAKFIFDAVKAYDTAAGIHKAASDHGSSPGTVKIAAQKKVGILAGEKLSVYAGNSVSLSGLQSASVFAGISASLKGLLWAGISSMHTSVKGYVNTSVDSQYGKTKIKSAKGTSVDSDKSTEIKGKKGVEVTSDEHAALQGKKLAYVGAGGGSGYGLTAKPEELSMGKIASSADKLSGPSLDDGISIKVNDTSISLTHGDSAIEVHPNYVMIQSKAGHLVKVESNGTIKADGTKVLIG